MIYARPAVPSLAKSDFASHLSTGIKKMHEQNNLHTHTKMKVFNSIFNAREEIFSVPFSLKSIIEDWST